MLRRYSFTDPKTRLTVVAEVRTYAGFPGAVDWVLSFRNDGPKDTPILEKILPLDLTLPGKGDSVVHHARGSNGDAADFQPEDDPIPKHGAVHLESSGGDSSSGGSLPFFNLQTGAGGIILGIGWTGNWKADFARSRHGLTVKIGMKKTHLLLHPGEQIRSPRIVLLHWTGSDWQEAQNAWRRLLLAHYTPQKNGMPMRGPVLVGSWGSESIYRKLALIHWMKDNAIPVDLYGVDAGWYGNSSGIADDSPHAWWKYRGDWYPNPQYYPEGLTPLGNALKNAGIGFSLWVEPETAMPGTEMLRDHPDWFLQSDHANPTGAALLNLGNPAAQAGVTLMISRFISDFGMTWYRQDFNIRPQRYWESADARNRVGATEIGDIEGLYAFWDELRAEHPALQIDNCASGGRRIDLETMSRSFVVWRTDYGFKDTDAVQAQTQALALWVPETMGFGSYTRSAPWKGLGPYDTPADLYRMRLAYDAGFGIDPGAPEVQNQQWVSWIKAVLAEYREVQPYFFGDFYALVPYSLSDAVWSAWQWNRPHQGDGLVIVLRRPQSTVSTIVLAVHRLNPDAFYAVEVRTGDQAVEPQVIKGSALARLQLTLPEAPASALVFYRQISPLTASRSISAN